MIKLKVIKHIPKEEKKHINIKRVNILNIGISTLDLCKVADMAHVGVIRVYGYNGVRNIKYGFLESSRVKFLVFHIFHIFCDFCGISLACIIVSRFRILCI